MYIRTVRRGKFFLSLSFFIQVKPRVLLFLQSMKEKRSSLSFVHVEDAPGVDSSSVIHRQCYFWLSLSFFTLVRFMCKFTDQTARLINPYRTRRHRRLRLGENGTTLSSGVQRNVCSGSLYSLLVLLPICTYRPVRFFIRMKGRIQRSRRKVPKAFLTSVFASPFYQPCRSFDV